MELSQHNTDLDTNTASKAKSDITILKNDESFFLDVEKDVPITKEDIFKKLYEKRKIGNLYTFLYRNGEPLIVIGPHCIYH
jgi:hypothetical protein